MSGSLSPRQFKFLYHESPAANREDILREGLKPGKGEASYAGPNAPAGVYMSPHKYSEYGSSYPGHDGPWFGFDRWRVNVEGLDVHADPTQPNSAHYHPGHIPPERLRLAKKAHPDWERHL